MAIYVYKISAGTLVSWCPNDTDPVATDLAARGLASVLGLPPLDPSHAWNPATHTVISVTQPKTTPTLLAFWKRFTPAERQAIENLLATGTQATKNQINAFVRYVQSDGNVDCNDAYVLASVQALETAAVIAAGRTAQIVV